MTIQAGSTTREILEELKDYHSNGSGAEESTYVSTMALVASLGNLGHQLEEIATYLASIEGQLFNR